jgi:predicted aconitase
MTKGKRKRLPMRFIKGGLVPAYGYVAEEIRRRGYKIGDEVMVEIYEARNPRFHRLGHMIGKLCVEQIPGFEMLDAHDALKRLQLEAGIECEESLVKAPDGKFYLMKSARSIAFDKMDEQTFQDFMRKICEHIAVRYLDSMDAENVEKILEAMVE